MIMCVVRIIVCVAIGVAIISKGYGMMGEASVVTQSFGFGSLGLGLLLIIYGFKPDRAKQIIAEISKIVREFLKALLKPSSVV